VEFKNKCDISNNRGNWNHLIIIQKTTEKQIWKARHQGTTENSRTGHCAGTSGSKKSKSTAGPEVSRKLRSSDFMTKAKDGDKVVSLTHRSPLPPGNTLGTHFC